MQSYVIRHGFVIPGHLQDGHAPLLCEKDNDVPGKQSLALVFVETKRGADAIENCMYTNGFPATSIHGDRIQQEREYAMRSFKSGATPILAATVVLPPSTFIRLTS